MELVLEIPPYQREAFLEFSDKNKTNETPEIKYSSGGESNGLKITVPDVITIVSTTVSAIELARLLIVWLKDRGEDKVSVKNRLLRAEITIKKGISEDEAIQLIKKLSELNEE